jgi:hypothetical protein
VCVEARRGAACGKLQGDNRRCFMKPSDLLRPPYRGATIGLVAAAVACGLIIHRLIDAATPASTSVRVVNASGGVATLAGVRLGVHPLLAGQLSLPPSSQGSGPPSFWDSKSLDLAPGLPMEVKICPARWSRVRKACAWCR